MTAFDLLASIAIAGAVLLMAGTVYSAHRVKVLDRAIEAAERAKRQPAE